MKQDALGNSVRGARSFGHFEAGVNHVNGADDSDRDEEQMERELDPQRTSILLCSFSHQIKSKSEVVRKKGTESKTERLRRGRTRTECGFAIDEEYPPRLDRTCAPLDAAHFDFLYRGILLRIRRQWLLDRARRAERPLSGALTSRRFATASGEPCVIKSIAPMSTAKAAAATRASSSRANLGFDVYERVGPLGRVIVRMHHFSTNEWVDEKRMSGRQRAMGEPPTFFSGFSLFSDDFVIQGTDAPKCLRANLVQNEYRGGRLRCFTFLGALIGDDERR
jgi:hypothetical protein